MKKFLPNLLVLLISLMVCLIILEFTARSVGREYFIQNNAFMLKDYPVFSYKPNNQYEVTRPEFTNTVRINSKGLRDYDYGYAKGNSTKRIIMLGDSMIAAIELPLRKTVSKKLEFLLNEGKKPNGGNFEVINMGFTGFGPTAEIIALEKEGIKYNPDIVILNLYAGNDFVRIDFGVSGDIGQEIFAVHDSLENLTMKSMPMQKLKNYFFRNYFTYSFLRKVISDAIAEEDPMFSDSLIYSQEYPDYIERNIGKLDTELAHLKRFADYKGITLLVVVLPTKEQVDMYESYTTGNKGIMNPSMALTKAQEEILEIGKRHNITMLDILPEFSRKNENNTFYFHDDPHWNEEGHALAAELEYNFLLKEGLVG